MSDTLPRRVTMAPDVLFRELDGEAVILDLNSERYYGLDEVGTRIWQLLAEHGDVATVRDLMLAEYDVDGETLTRDMAGLIAHLVENGLVATEAWEENN
jgi:hypothetical protein